MAVSRGEGKRRSFSDGDFSAGTKVSAFFLLSERKIGLCIAASKNTPVCFNTMTKLTKAEYTMSVNECKADLFASRGLCC